MTVLDLSFRALFAHANGRPYAVTGSFYGRDLLNGGIHQAVDVGNFGMDDPIRAPVNGRARGLYHFDSAIGIEYELGDGWLLQLWHLNATLAPLEMVPGRASIGAWQQVTRGQVCGRTGNSGARLPDGSPMPAHTHIELLRAGVRYDVEPFLLGRPFDTAPEADMDIPPNLAHLVQATVGKGNNLRTQPNTTAPKETLEADGRVAVFGILEGGPYTLNNQQRTDWAMVGTYRGVRYVAAPLLAGVSLTSVGSRTVPTGSLSAEELKRVQEAARSAGRIEGRDIAAKAAAAAPLP